MVVVVREELLLSLAVEFEAREADCVVTGGGEMVGIEAEFGHAELG